MALSAQTTKISMHDSKRPDGYTDPGGSNLSNSAPFYENLELEITKSNVENATKSTTFDNIRTDATYGIEKLVADLLTNDMDVTNTVTYNIDWKDIKDNQAITEEFYSNVAQKYIAIVDVYINIT